MGEDVHGTADGHAPTLIKRCLAIPGDSVLLRGGTLTVNGVPARRGGIEAGDFLGEDVPVRVPEKGDVVILDGHSSERWRALIEREGHAVSSSPDGTVMIDGHAAGSYAVEHAYLFVMGDRTDISLDSRHWGLLSTDRVVGEPVLVYWSRDDGGSPRLDRFGTLVR